MSFENGPIGSEVYAARAEQAPDEVMALLREMGLVLRDESEKPSLGRVHQLRETLTTVVRWYADRFKPFGLDAAYWIYWELYREYYLGKANRRFEDVLDEIFFHGPHLMSSDANGVYSGDGAERLRRASLLLNDPRLNMEINRIHAPMFAAQVTIGDAGENFEHPFYAWLKKVVDAAGTQLVEQ